MPFFEKLSKDLKGLISDSILWIKNGGKLGIIVTYPDFPSNKTTIQKIAKKLGYRLSNRTVPSPDVILFFENTTDKSAFNDPALKPYRNVLNRNCKDISKKMVDAVHQQVFGYCTIIDPLNHKGIAVIKSDENAMHDGKIVTCPLTEIDESRVYQVLIDNSLDAHSVVDLRVPVIGNMIPLVYQKFKTNALRFTNEVFKSSLHKTDELLSKKEQLEILEFAKQMKVDFAELDVLRDNSSGKIYAIDVNTTPYGPPKGLSAEEDKTALDILSRAFHEEFLT